MNYLFRLQRKISIILSIPVKILFVMLFMQLAWICVFANPEVTTSEDQTTVIVNDAPEQDVIVFGKSIEVKNRAKSALAIGGDVVVEGGVSGDVGAIGGNIVQKENAYIGGDVIVFGGAYKAESPNPLREEGKQTLMLGIFEEQLRDFGKNPAGIFSPSVSWAFLIQRLVLGLFWFIITMVVTTIAPGAVSRAVARIHLSSLKVCALGAGAFLAITAAVICSALILPNYLGATLGIMGLVLLLMGYVFGRVSLQISLGKAVQKYFFNENNRSETLATLIGVLLLTFFLSLPYLWIIVLFSVFTFGLGLILTGRSSTRWQNP